MRSARMFAFALVLALVGAVATAAAAPATSSSPSATASTTFTDPVGDAQGSGDITTVAVADDYSTGTITFALTVTGFPQGEDDMSAIDLSVDTDKNPATGDSLGADYALMAIRLGSVEPWTWGILRLTGGELEVVPTSPTASFNASGDTYTWTLNKSDLGGTTGFNFNVATLWLGEEDDGFDFAPDEGNWTYDLSTPPPPVPVGVKPVIAKPTTVPARAVAGKRFTVSFKVTRSDTGAPLTSGKMICDPSVTGKVIRHAESFKRGTARLSFVIPKSAKGKLLKVKLTIKSGTQSARKVATFRVR